MDFKQTVGCAGCLDGKTMIKMNNIAVGYFPIDTTEIGIYPPPITPPDIIEENQDLEKSS